MSSMLSETQIPRYLQTPENFLRHRLEYYADASPISPLRLSEKIFPESLLETPFGEEVFLQRERAIDKLRISRADVTIVTATNNRAASIRKSFDLLQTQVGKLTWNWLIIDNGTDTETPEFISSTKDPRIIYVRFREKTGCAYPIRNFGLDLVHFAKYKQVYDPGWILVVDSDDSLHNENSLQELIRIANAMSFRRWDKALVHGYSDTEIHEPTGYVTHVPNPRDLDSSFPKVGTLKEVFDKGLNILAGMFPVDLLDWLRYPSEFSFEDDGFNQKLLLQAVKKKIVWIADRVPITTKVFHKESMSGKSDEVGDQSLSGRVGPYLVKGVRAQIVIYLQKLSDYYSQQGL